MKTKPSTRRVRFRRQGLVVILALAAGGLLLTMLLGSLAFSLLGLASPLPAALPGVTQPAAALPTATLEPPTPTLTASPSPAPTATVTASPLPTLDVRAAALLAGMTREQKVGQLLMVGVEGQAAGCGYLGEMMPGAVVYRSGNISGVEQARQLSAGLQDCVAQAGLPPLWIAIDHEGQYVNRFAGDLTTFPAAMAIGATGNPEFSYQAAQVQGQQLASVGVNLVLGPVADVLENYDNSVITLRSYGGDPPAVAQMAAQAVAGYQAAGLAAALKHFPGHGGSSADSHASLPVDSADLTGWRTRHALPFAAGVQAGAQVVMVGHVAFPDIDPSGLPATLSPVLLGLLRSELGFNGVILSDSLGMGAIKQEHAVDEAGLLAVQAGVDMLLVTSEETARAVRGRLLQAAESGQLSLARLDEAAGRVLAAKLDQGWDALAVQAPPAGLDAGASLAQQMGYLAPVVLRARDGLVPLPPSAKRVAVFAPPGGWGLEAALRQALEKQGRQLSFIYYPGPWDGPAAGKQGAALAQQAAGYDLALVFTWDSHLESLVNASRLQIRLVRGLQDLGLPLVVAALKSPVDVVDFPDVPAYLASFGTTTGQVQALADLLAGSYHNAGGGPLPALLEP